MSTLIETGREVVVVVVGDVRAGRGHSTTLEERARAGRTAMLPNRQSVVLLNNEGRAEFGVKYTRSVEEEKEGELVLLPTTIKSG